MSPTSPFRHGSGYSTRPRTFSAWAMAIGFAAVAIFSFAVDQTVTLSPGPDESRIEIPPRPIGETLAEFNPVRLIVSLIEAGAGRSEETR